MSERRVRTAAGSNYPVRIERSLQPALGEVLAEIASPSKVLVVTDAHVAALHLDRVLGAFGGGAASVTLQPGEGTKGVAGLEEVWRAMSALGLDRQALVVALGGGVVGDLAGFAAATYMRGVRVLHLPTSLLAMADSAVGGKTAINLGSKNLVGAFHAPVGVVADVSALVTLPGEELRCGLGEVWKTAILAGSPLLEALEACAAELAAMCDREGGVVPAAALASAEDRGSASTVCHVFAPLVAACVEHKAGVVERDERESGERALLNLGHTLGHALEVVDPGLTHGEAVVVGGLFACRLAEDGGRLDPAVTRRFQALAEALRLPTRPTQAHDPDALLALVAGDKKAQAGRTRWVLPRGPGHCEVFGDVPEALVREALEKLLQRDGLGHS